MAKSVFNRRRQALSLAPWSKDGRPPKEFALFYFGANESTKGTVYLTKSSALKCLTAWRDYGNTLIGDYEHAVTEIQPEGAPASCRFDLAVKSDGIYAVNVRWTPRAQKYFADKEYFYYSPYFSIEKDAQDRWLVVEIINLALTNNPATKNQRPLIAVSWGRKVHDMLSQELIDKLKALAVEKGMPEESAADFLLALMPMLEMGEESGESEAPASEMPLACAPEDKAAMGDMPAAEPDMQALSKDVTKAMQTQMAAMAKEIAELKKQAFSREVEKRNALFSQFKKEGRLRFAKEADARAILEQHGESAFRMAFGAVTPLVEQSAPKSPENLKSTADLSKNAPKLGSNAPLFDEDEVKVFLSKPENKGMSYRDALVTLSRTAKGNK